MKPEKEVVLSVEYFVDALEIMDKMNNRYMCTEIFMNEDEFDKGKCYMIVGNTKFIFVPVCKLFNKKETDNDI